MRLGSSATLRACDRVQVRMRTAVANAHHLEEWTELPAELLWLAAGQAPSGAWRRSCAGAAGASESDREAITVPAPATH